MLLSEVLSLLAPYPHITETFTLHSLVLFIQLTRHLRERLLWHVSAHVTDAPLHLPSDVRSFLAVALGIDLTLHPTTIDDCWSLLRGVVWDGAPIVDAPTMASSGGDLADIFAVFGVPHGIGAS